MKAIDKSVQRFDAFGRAAMFAPLLLLAACGAAPEVDSGARALVAAPDGPLVASVNGETVTEPVLMVYARGHGLDPADPAERQKALDSLIENILLAQHGIETGVASKPEVQAELALVRMQQLAGRTMSTLRSSLTITDEQVAEFYSEEARRAGDTEWRLQHLLFADRAQAEAALAQALEPGADFDRLIEQFTGVARQAKTLDWGHAMQLPDELVGAARQLTPGQVAPVVIETSFGWHVVRLLEQRPFTPPPLQQVEAGARRQLIERAIADQVAALKAKAQIAAPGSTTAPSGN